MVRVVLRSIIEWQKVCEAEGEHTARVWFIGANPWLGYDTPVNAIREGRLSAVAGAAQALVDDSFSGEAPPHSAPPPTQLIRLTPTRRVS